MNQVTPQQTADEIISAYKKEKALAVNIRRRASYAANRDMRRAQARAWAANNPDKIKAKNDKQKAKLALASAKQAHAGATSIRFNSTEEMLAFERARMAALSQTASNRITYLITVERVAA